MKPIKIAESLAEIPFNEAGLAEIEINGKTLCVALYNDQLSACYAKCPHASGRLSQGYIDALGNIVCPLHRYKFSLKNGRNISGEGFFLKTYRVDQNENGIFVFL